MPPGPWSLPVIGSIHQIDPKQPHRSFKKLSLKYGGILSIRMGLRDRIVYITDLDLINKIFFDQRTSDRPPLNVFKYLTKDIDGIGSSSYGNNFKKQKHLIVNAINTIRNTSAQHKIEKIMKQYLRRMSESEGESFDPKESIIELTCSLFSSLVYGSDYNGFNDPELQTIISNHKTVMDCISPFHPLNIMSLFWWIPNKWLRGFYKCIKDRDIIITRKCYQTKKINSEDKNHQENIINILLTEHDIHEKQDIKNLIMSAWTVFLAGSESVRSLCLWTLQNLGLYTQMQNRIYHDVQTVVEENSFPNIQQKHELPYTCAFILETMRVCQANVLGIPHCTSADIQIDNNVIPKGTMIMLGFWDNLNNSKQWAEATKFNPDRFLDENNKLIKYQTLNSFIVFGKGHRMCPGSSITLDLMFLFVTALVKCFLVELHLKDGEKIDTNGQFSFGLEPSPYKIRLTKRNNINHDNFL
ncbi:hypothetical protein SNE40_022808 [Patella caerulea]